MKGFDPADSILECSRKDYDLIVMGARGKKEKDPFALGSVTKKVIRHTTLPILVVKRDCVLSSLLVCVDGSEYSIKALSYATKLAEKMYSKITLLNVQERRLFDLSVETAKQLGTQILSNAQSALGRSRVKIDKRLEFGVPSDSILEVADRGDHDLIVLGSRGLGKVKRFLLGSVSDHVSHKAKHSILIFRAKYE